MTRGLLWLPLLALFIGLAWAGWHEYQKIEAYRRWAESFERAKYDIYAVLGQQGSDLTWGKPTRQGPIQLQTFSLIQVETIGLLVDGQAMALDTPPDKGQQVALVFHQAESMIQVPFTDLALAVQWGLFLQGEQKRLNS